MAIKNFTGRRARPDRRIEEGIRVADFMTTNLITFRPEQTIMEVMEILLRRGISGGPVVNDQNELIGMISEGDCLKELCDARYHNHPMEDVKVELHMIKKVDTVAGDMHVLDAANMFLETKHRRFPILENGKLVGQISQSDVMKAVMALRGQTW